MSQTTIQFLSPPTNQMEEWRPVKGFEDYYAVSNLGRVKSIERKVPRVNYSGRVTTKFVAERIMKPTIASNGYYVVNLSRGNKKHLHLLHRIIAISFIPNPENKAHINHKNGIRTDFSLYNLEWVTHAENMQHSFDHLSRVSGMKGKRGSLCPNSKKVILITPEGKYEVHESIIAACEKYNLSNGNAGAVLKGLRKHTKGFRFKLLSVDREEATLIYERINNGST